MASCMVYTTCDAMTRVACSMEVARDADNKTWSFQCNEWISANVNSEFSVAPSAHSEL
jgi:hypothetical protein